MNKIPVIRSYISSKLGESFNKDSSLNGHVTDSQQYEAPLSDLTGSMLLPHLHQTWHLVLNAKFAEGLLAAKLGSSMSA